MTATTRPSEIGELGGNSLRDMIRRVVGGASVTTYAEAGTPIEWDVIADGGWDLLGVVEDGDGATLRDLVEIARVWGNWCVPLPLLPTILAKRHSEAARRCAGPVSFAIRSATRDDDLKFLPYGQIDRIAIVLGLGEGEDVVKPFTRQNTQNDDFDVLMRGAYTADDTSFSSAVVREIAVVLAAECTGAADRMVDDGVAYVKERHQFGRPVGSFQAVKHHLANSLIAAELAETSVIWASENPADAVRGALFAIDRSVKVGELILQVHGGIGFTWEMGLHFYLRRMLMARDLVTGLAALHGLSRSSSQPHASTMSSNTRSPLRPPAIATSS